MSLLLTGLGWGAVEAASNPMVAALYPEEKTHRLNILHAWWPAGIVVGGLMGVAIGALDLSWKLNMYVLLIPALVLAWMVASSAFPVTERVASGVSYKDMLMELIKRPLFWVFWVCMYFTAASELAPGQWVDISLSNVVGMPGILVLVYVSALMFVGRHFAGPIVDRVSSVGLLFVSCIAAGLGLYLLSLANSPALAFGAATVWGLGVCYMWPTMLAIAAERFPKGGAVAMGLMGFAGGMSIQFVLPRMGADLRLGQGRGRRWRGQARHVVTGGHGTPSCAMRQLNRSRRWPSFRCCCCPCSEPSGCTTESKRRRKRAFQSRRTL